VWLAEGCSVVRADCDCVSRQTYTLGDAQTSQAPQSYERRKSAAVRTPMILIRYVCLSLALVQCSADAHPLWFMLEDPDDILAAYRLSNQLRQWQTRFSQLPSISDPYFQQSPGSSTSQWIFPSQQTSPQQVRRLGFVGYTRVFDCNIVLVAGVILLWKMISITHKD